MTQRFFRIAGQVIDRESRRGLAGLHVEAWDKDLIIDDLVGSAITNEQGAFRMTFDVSYFQELFADRQPDLFFKVFYQDRLIQSTEDSILWNKDKGDIMVIIEVDDPTEVTEVPYIVKGEVNISDETPARGVKVRAFNKSLQEETLLGETNADRNGSYEIRCQAVDLSELCLIVRAYGPDGKTEIGESEIAFGVGEETILDITIDRSGYQGPSEYERLVEDLTPEVNDINILDLSGEEIEFLSQKARINNEHLLLYIDSLKLSESADVSPEVFYGLGREGIPIDPDMLINTNPTEIRTALEGALSRNLVPVVLSEQIDEFQNSIRRLAVDHMLKDPEAGSPANLGSLLKTADIDEQKFQTFVDLYYSHEGSVDEFWKNVAACDEFTTEESKALLFTVRLGSLTHNHIPLVKELQRRKTEGEIHTLKDLAKWDVDTWKDIIHQETIGVPDGIPGEDQAQKAQNYAQALRNIVEFTYPTAVVSAEVEKDHDLNGRADLLTFFGNNPEFELGQQKIDDYLEQCQDRNPLENIPDPEAFKNRLKSFQRQFNLSPGVDRYTSMKTLMSMGLDSAWGIYDMDWEEFSSQYAEKGGHPEAAKIVYPKAGFAAAAATAINMRYRQDFSLETYVTRIPGYQEQIKESANLTRLFGSQDYCECKHCHSVYSPAAYLTDILLFLQNIPGAKTTDVLFHRRPDIGHMKLTCENTHTPLPYIDLVNEILENAAIQVSEANSAIHTTIRWEDYQTTLTSEELLANPEHMNSRAYNIILKDAIYPWHLPFDLWTEKSRVYLDHLGVKRRDLLDVFDQTGNYLTEEVNINEWLNLISKDREILLGSNTAKGWEHWGLKKNDSYPDLNNPNTSVTLHWTEALARVPIFLERSGLTFDDLKLLLEHFPWSKDYALRLDYDEENPCTLSLASISGLSEGCLDLLHRFVRLQKRIGWSFADLGKAINAMDASTIDADLLRQLSHLQRLRSELNTPLVEMLSWYANIDTNPAHKREEQSLYDRLFLNKTVLNPDDKLFILNIPGSDLEINNNPLANNQMLNDPKIAPNLQAAFGMDEKDLTLLITDLVPGGKLNLFNLSLLYRNVSLARTLHLSVPELISLKALTGIDPFDKTQTKHTILFLEKVRHVKTSGFTIDKLNYLFKHRSKASLALVPSEKQIQLILNEIREGSDRIEGKYQELHNVIADANASAEEKEWAKAQLLLKREYVIERLSVYLKLDPANTKALISEWIDSPNPQSSQAKKAIDDFLNPAVTDGERMKTYLLLYKIIAITNRLTVSSEEFKFLFHKGVDQNWQALIDFSQVPVTEPDKSFSPKDLFTGWEKLVKLFRFRDSVPEGKLKLFDILSDAHTGTVNTDILLKNISGFTEWNLKDLKALAKAFQYTAKEFLEPDAWLRLESCLALSKRIGVSAGKLAEWAAQTPDDKIAAAIKNTAKSRYDLEQWVKNARPLRNQLREKQRDALVAYLVAFQPGIRDVDDLYGYYLIDLQMSPCMLTSRIKQAISAAQLFIQRCLLNLEYPYIKIRKADEKKWAQWKWMKNYRVWEANRKVFLYPENWVEPQLRDNKSPFFKELENELLQGEITKETVEKALLNYLKKLDVVSNLDIWAICREENLNILHVFGRTRGTSPAYYYRKRIESSYWTPWEKVDVDIEGDHLIPVVFNRRLYLFWPVFEEKTLPVSSLKQPTGEEEPEKPTKYWEIRLAWAEYRSGEWSSKTESVEGLDKYLKMIQFPDPKKYKPPASLHSDKQDINFYGNYLASAA